MHHHHHHEISQYSPIARPSPYLTFERVVKGSGGKVLTRSVKAQPTDGNIGRMGIDNLLSDNDPASRISVSK